MPAAEITYPGKSIGNKWFASEANEVKTVVNSHAADIDDHEGRIVVLEGATLPDHNDTLSIQGGSATERFHLTSAQHSGLTGAADTTLHTHDGRYYTEAEVDALLLAKAAAVHTHAAGDTTSGTFAAARLGSGAAAGSILYGDSVFRPAGIYHRDFSVVNWTSTGLTTIYSATINAGVLIPGRKARIVMGGTIVNSGSTNNITAVLSINGVDVGANLEQFANNATTLYWNFVAEIIPDAAGSNYWQFQFGAARNNTSEFAMMCSTSANTANFTTNNIVVALRFQASVTFHNLNKYIGYTEIL